MTENNQLKVWEKELVLLAEKVKRDMNSNPINKAPEIMKSLLEIMNTWKKEFVSASFSAQEKYTLALNWNNTTECILILKHEK